MVALQLRQSFVFGIGVCVLLLPAFWPESNSAQAAWHGFRHKLKRKAPQSRSAPVAPTAKKGAAGIAAPPGKTAKPAAASKENAASDSDNDNNASAPLVVPPATLFDLSSARFGNLDIDLRNAAFLDASAEDLRLQAANMDMNAGSLDSLKIDMQRGQFQDFTIDDLLMNSQASLKFDTNELLNNKVLQFAEPTQATVVCTIRQSSLNSFLNSQKVLKRLSGSAKKRIPILSSMACHDVNFGFDFLDGHVDLLPDDHLHLTMDSKVGVGKMKVAVPLSVDTKLLLNQGWVNLTDTHLLTSGQMVPRDMAAKIVNRVNSLSKWGTASDDIQFQFTNLKVVPEDKLELEGTAIIRRLRLTRAAGADNTQK